MLLSGVVRNRKVAISMPEPTTRPHSVSIDGRNIESGLVFIFLPDVLIRFLHLLFYCYLSLFSRRFSSTTVLGRLWNCINCPLNLMMSRLELRVHKFAFQWDLLFCLVVCIGALLPFYWSGNRIFAVLPVIVWASLNALFLLEGR